MRDPHPGARLYPPFGRVPVFQPQPVLRHQVLPVEALFDAHRLRHAAGAGEPVDSADEHALRIAFGAAGEVEEPEHVAAVHVRLPAAVIEHFGAGRSAVMGMGGRIGFPAVRLGLRHPELQDAAVRHPPAEEHAQDAGGQLRRSLQVEFRPCKFRHPRPPPACGPC